MVAPIRHAALITLRDAHEAVALAQEVDAALSRHFSDQLDAIRPVAAWVAAWCDGHFRHAAWSQVQLAVAALLDVLAPAEQLPDLVPLVGVPDTHGELSTCRALLDAELRAFFAWSAGQAA